MADIAGRPFLEYLLLWLRRQGFGDVVVSVGHMAEAIESHFGDGGRLGMSISYAREDRPLGTAGAFRLAAGLAGGDSWLVLNGDSIFEIALGELVDAHERRSAAATIALASVPDAGRYGSVLLDGTGRITAFVEKGRAAGEAGLINAGVYVLERRVALSVPQGRSVSLEREVFPELVGAGLFGHAFTGAFIDIGVPDDYARLRADVGWLTRLVG